MSAKYRVVFLTDAREPLEANLDELSLQGWDFVAWVDDRWCLKSVNPRLSQRRALVRQVNTPGQP
jgi:hypothetical protein